MKKKTLVLSMMLLSLSSWAQSGSASTSFWNDPVNHPLTPFYLLLVLIAIVIVLVIVVAFVMIRVLNTVTEKVAQERAEKLGIVYKAEPSLWNKMVQSLNASVPLDEEKKIELDHNYDGIRELDNHLPPWWKWLFYATIAWSVVYIIAYHVTDSLPLSDDEYQQEVAIGEEQKRKFLAAQPKAEIDENTLTYAQDEALIAKGKDLYEINCSPCHKADGGGGIGPNLTDAYWLHGGDIKNVYATIKNGVPEKGMVAWQSVMSPEQIRNVSFFVMSLQGTNPAGAKAAQGELFMPTSTTVKADSSKVQASL